MEESKDKDKGLESWMKRLVNEPLKPIEEKTEKREDFSDRKYWGLMGTDEEEHESYQYGKKLLENEMGTLEKEYRLSGKINPLDKRMIKVEKLLKEEKSEGRTYQEFEERYRNLQK